MCAAETYNPSIASADILKIVLRIDRIAHFVALLCIENIQNGNIYGRQAIYCIAEIRIFIISLRSQALTKHSRADPFENVLTPIDATNQIVEIASFCILPVINNRMQELSRILICFDLIPISIMALASIHNVVGSRLRNGTVSALDDCKSISDILELILISAEWDSTNLLPLSNLICELYIYLSKPQVIEFKVLSEPCFKSVRSFPNCMH